MTAIRGTARSRWKAVVFMDGNFRRALAGSTDDPWLHGFGEGVVAPAERAELMAFAEDAG